MVAGLSPSTTVMREAGPHVKCSLQTLDATAFRGVSPAHPLSPLGGGPSCAHVGAQSRTLAVGGVVTVPARGLRSGCCGCPTGRTPARFSRREQKNVRAEERAHMMPAPACVMRPCDVPVRPVRSDHTTQKLRHGFFLVVTVSVGTALAALGGLGLFFFMGNEQWRGTDSAMKRDRLVYVTTSY